MQRDLVNITPQDKNINDTTQFERLAVSCKIINNDEKIPLYLNISDIIGDLDDNFLNVLEY